MIVTTIDSVTTKHLRQDYKTINGVGLCYLDPSDEILKEFSDDLSIPIYPNEETVRQFYIVKDNPSLYYNTVSFKITSGVENYTVKCSLNKEQVFETIPENNSVVAFFSANPTGIIPVYVYTKNTKDTYEDIKLEIELDLE